MRLIVVPLLPSCCTAFADMQGQTLMLAEVRRGGGGGVRGGGGKGGGMESDTHT